jgi:hypothetical protein
MTTLIILAVLCLCIGVLLIGLATVKEAFWPVPTRRVEIGSVAVEHRGGDGFGSKSDAAWFKARDERV